MVRLWWLLWPQPARSPPQRWRQMAEHSEAPLGVAPPQPDTTWCGCGGCTIRLLPWWCMATVGGGLDRSGYGKSFLVRRKSSPEKLSGGSRLEMVVAGRRWPAAGKEENYVLWSSCLLRYAKSRLNGKLIHNSIINGPYVRRMIPEPGDTNQDVPEIWLRFQQMMKGSNIGIQKKAKLFNEWERFTSNECESIESYYHHFLKLMNDLKRNKQFPEKIASNLKFLNNLQPEWSRHVTIVHQTKDLHTAD
nr:hypothetical protein [Tanacetum cinerariifolium]